LGGACSTCVTDEGCIQNYVLKKTERKRPFERRRRRWKDDIGMDLRATG